MFAHAVLAGSAPLAHIYTLYTSCIELVLSTSRISSVVSESEARALPCASSGSRPRVMRHCRAGCSPLHVHVSESVVSTGTATVSTGMAGRYLATSRAVDPPRVSTTINDACT